MTLKSKWTARANLLHISDVNICCFLTFVCLWQQQWHLSLRNGISWPGHVKNLIRSWLRGSAKKKKSDSSSQPSSTYHSWSPLSTVLLVQPDHKHMHLFIFVHKPFLWTIFILAHWKMTFLCNVVECYKMLSVARQWPAWLANLGLGFQIWIITDCYPVVY